MAQRRHSLLVGFQAHGTDYVGTFDADLRADLDSTDIGTGIVKWTYEVDDSALADLAPGERRVQSYDVTIADQHGALTTRTIDVAPTLAALAAETACVPFVNLTRLSGTR